MKVSIVVEPDEDKFYGWCPDLRGVFVDGDTFEETKDILKEAILLHLEIMLENNIPLPNDIFVPSENSDKNLPPLDRDGYHSETAELKLAFA